MYLMFDHIGLSACSSWNFFAQRCGGTSKLDFAHLSPHDDTCIEEIQDSSNRLLHKGIQLMVKG